MKAWRPEQTWYIQAVRNCQSRTEVRFGRDTFGSQLPSSQISKGINFLLQDSQARKPKAGLRALGPW